MHNLTLSVHQNEHNAIFAAAEKYNKSKFCTMRFAVSVSLYNYGVLKFT